MLSQSPVRLPLPSRVLRDWRRISRRLFFKIFFVFWLAMTAAGVILLAVETTRNAQMARRWRGVTGDAFAVYAASAAQDYLPAADNPNPRTLREFLGDLETRTAIRAWIFEEKGREISGYAAAPRRKLPPWLRERMSQIAARARQSRQTEFADLEGLTLAAHAAVAEDGQILVLVGTLQDARYDFWGAAARVQLLRLLAILATAGAVAWFLARHLAQPLGDLRAATHRLAAGDFSARAGEKLGRRRDEMSELAADFNSMAARIERLLDEQKRLIAAQRHLLADVAHELRSPLARASVALELARDALENKAPQTKPDLALAKNSLDRIERETGQLAELIDRLLTIARLESGVQAPENAVVDVAALVRSVVSDADFEARSRGRRVDLTACAPCFLVGTPALLRSAIENVVRNAVRHTPENRAVEVALEVESAAAQHQWSRAGLVAGCYTSPLHEGAILSPNSAILTVQDAGCGVPEAELEAIFQPFYRAGSGRPRESGGAGLGLTITARAIELHGGQFRLCNRDAGGLEVQLRLPLQN